MKNYSSYRDLPALAGICSMEKAMKPGLSVEECVSRLKRLHYAFKRLHEIFISRLTAEPIYELKTAFSYHGYLCSENASALRVRVGEMREPPLGLEQIPDSNLEIFFDELLAAPTTEELIAGLYSKAIPALKAAWEKHLGDTNPLADHPSVRLGRFSLSDLEEMRQFGQKAIESLGAEQFRDGSWLSLLDRCLAAAGGLDGTSEPGGEQVQRLHSAKTYAYDPKPRRDERFPDPYNMSVNAEVFLYHDKFDPFSKVLMMYYKRLREIDVPEMMASIISETRNKPWKYYQDMTRQLWDEARHAMMGEVGFVHLGVDWRKVMVNFTWSLALNTQLKPIERHAVLYFIEQGLMSKTGKRYEWEIGVASQNPMAALFQDYDWADEVLHARIGRDWYLKEFKDPREAVQYGDQCWSRVLMDWEKWRQEGLTEHRNWWPEVYEDACRLTGTEPNPEVRNYSTSYRSVRADLKSLPSSG